MKTFLKYSSGHTFLAKSDSNHWIPIDTGEKSGGSGAANDPFQLFIISATGCMSVDIVDMLTKARSEITSLEVETEAVRAEQHPKSLLHIHFHVSIVGQNITDTQLKRAIMLSLTKYCSVSLSIDRAVRFTAQYTINDLAGESWEVNRLPLPHYR